MSECNFTAEPQVKLSVEETSQWNSELKNKLFIILSKQQSLIRWWKQTIEFLTTSQHKHQHVFVLLLLFFFSFIMFPSVMCSWPIGAQSSDCLSLSTECSCYMRPADWEYSASCTRLLCTNMLYINASVIVKITCLQLFIKLNFYKLSLTITVSSSWELLSSPGDVTF